MKRFVEGVDRGQSTLFQASLDDYVAEENPVRAVDMFVDGLDLNKLGFVGVQPLVRTGLIALLEVRSPMVQIGGELAAQLDREIERRTASTALGA